MFVCRLGNGVLILLLLRPFVKGRLVRAEMFAMLFEIQGLAVDAQLQKVTTFSTNTLYLRWCSCYSCWTKKKNANDCETLI